MHRYSRIAFGFLIALGTFLIFYGLVSPISTGAAFAEVVVQQLDLPDDPDTYDRLASVYADHEGRRNVVTMIVGFLVLLPSGLGFWALGRDQRRPKS